MSPKYALPAARDFPRTVADWPLADPEPFTSAPLDELSRSHGSSGAKSYGRHVAALVAVGSMPPHSKLTSSRLNVAHSRHAFMCYPAWSMKVQTRMNSSILTALAHLVPFPVDGVRSKLRPCLSPRCRQCLRSRLNRGIPKRMRFSRSAAYFSNACTIRTCAPSSKNPSPDRVAQVAEFSIASSGSGATPCHRQSCTQISWRNIPHPRSATYSGEGHRRASRVGEA
jgi:hypothetical protein